MDLRAERKLFEMNWEPKKECGKFVDIECKQSPNHPQTTSCMSVEDSGTEDGLEARLRGLCYYLQPNIGYIFQI